MLGDARLYRIPNSGVLLTQVQPNVGTGPSWRSYFEGADGTRKRIQRVLGSPVPDTPPNRADPAIGVFGIRVGRTTRRGEGCPSFEVEKHRSDHNEQHGHDDDPDRRTEVELRS